MSTPETTYYQDKGITITNTRAVLGEKTYAMANITSVSMGVLAANRAPGYIVALIGVIIAGCLAGSEEGSISIGGIVIGLIVLGIGIAIAASIKPKYIVKIGSASGESNALVAVDREYIQKIVNAVNEAIIKRG